MKVSSFISQVSNSPTAEQKQPYGADVFKTLLENSGSVSEGQQKQEDWNTYFDKNIFRYAEYENTMSIKEVFGNVIQKARDDGGLDNPKKTLLSLSQEELRAVQLAHRVAEPLTPQRINNLTDEGAYNLLVSPENTRDLDGNGLTAIAEGQMFKFPTEHTDPAVAKAWNEFTADLDFKDKMMAEAKLMLTITFANFDAEKGTQIEPTDPSFRNPLNEPDFSFKDWLNDIYGGLEFQRGDLGEDEFMRQMSLWKKFGDLLDKYNVA